MVNITQILLLMSISLTLFACILGSFALYYALRAYIDVCALKNSTHTITYTPVDKEIDEANKLWATKQEALREQMKAYREDIEEENNKIFSF